MTDVNYLEIPKNQVSMVAIKASCGKLAAEQRDAS